MKLINHVIISKISDDLYVMINSLNGRIDKINNTTFKILQRWRGKENIIPFGDDELASFDYLKSHGYFVQNDTEENNKKNELLTTLKEKHQLSAKHITFIMGYTCNFKCAYCFESNGSSHKKAHMSIELIDAAFKLIDADLESIGLFGGEPLLPTHKNAIEYIISNAPDKTYNITTNGFYLKEYLPILNKIKISSIMVTLDGEEDVHNKRRLLTNNKSTYAKILQGITLCLTNNIPICIRMNLDETNYESCIKLKNNLLMDFKNYEHLLSFEMSPMFENQGNSRNIMLTSLYNINKNCTYDDLLKSNRFISRFGSIINSVILNQPLYPSYSFCDAHRDGYLVDPYGNIYPCIPSVGHEKLAIGKYFPHIEFKENSIRTRNIDKILECRNCKYSLLCGGGCPIGLDDYENVYKPECGSIKNQIYNLMPMLYNSKSTQQAQKDCFK